MLPYKVWNCQALSLDIWYVASSNGTLAKFVQIMFKGADTSTAPGVIFYIGLYRDIKQSSFLLPQGFKP